MVVLPERLGLRLGRHFVGSLCGHLRQRMDALLSAFDGHFTQLLDVLAGVFCNRRCVVSNLGRGERGGTE